MSSQKPLIPVIVGPTASGKTELSIQLARSCGGEIISADSRQIYRLMDIGTAKPSRQQLNEVPHHCIDFLDPYKDYSAGEYARKALGAIRKVIARGHIPIVAGGSGLYVRALVDGMFEGEVRDETMRAALKARLQSGGLDALYRELERIDPVSAKAIHPNNEPRVLRALEIYQITGKPRSQLWAENQLERPFDSIHFGLYWPREILYKRINARVDSMLNAGLTDEVMALADRGYGPQCNSMNTLGYKEVLSYLQNGTDRDTMRIRIQQNTRRFAKRQMTWFRKDSRINWIPMHRHENLERIARYMIQWFSSQQAEGD